VKIILNQQAFLKLSLCLTALYGAIVVGMSAAISHVFLAQFDGKMLASLLSSTALLAFQTLALLAVGLYLKTLATPGKLLPLVVVGWHLGLWLFVYTVWAGLFALPLHFGKLAPLGGQLLLLSWLLLAVIAWIRK
jgi:uncharacterized membrane protein YgdD (TMEM256/DUF423 family)